MKVTNFYTVTSRDQKLPGDRENRVNDRQGVTFGRDWPPYGADPNSHF